MQGPNRCSIFSKTPGAPQFAKFVNSRRVQCSAMVEPLCFEGLTDWPLHCDYKKQEVLAREAKRKVSIP